MPNRVVHFEIEASDRERAKAFYSKAFGWDLQQMGEEMQNYVMVMTGAQDEPGGINGGIYATEPGKDKEVNAFSCVIGVDDLDASVQSVKSAGGEVLIGRMDIPGVGVFARCKDTEGNIFTMLQAVPAS